MHFENQMDHFETWNMTQTGYWIVKREGAPTEHLASASWQIQGFRLEAMQIVFLFQMLSLFKDFKFKLLRYYSFMSHVWDVFIHESVHFFCLNYFMKNQNFVWRVISRHQMVHHVQSIELKHMACESLLGCLDFVKYYWEGIHFSSHCIRFA